MVEVVHNGKKIIQIFHKIQETGKHCMWETYTHGVLNLMLHPIMILCMQVCLMLCMSGVVCIMKLLYVKMKIMSKAKLDTHDRAWIAFLALHSPNGTRGGSTPRAVFAQLTAHNYCHFLWGLVQELPFPKLFPIGHQGPTSWHTWM